MTPNKQRALEALLTQPTKAEAARAAGIDPATLRRYLSDKEFLEYYREAVRGLVEDATRQAQQAMNPALSTLTEIATDSKAGHAARVSASRSLLEFGLRLTEINDILDELGERDVL